jgi:hypothetical protein
MRLATLNNGTRVGALVVVHPSAEVCARAREIAPTPHTA